MLDVGPAPPDSGTRGAGRLGRDALLGAAVDDAHPVERYRRRIVTVPGSDCWWWCGAVSGAGHGRFWVAGTTVLTAHRFGFALNRGAEELRQARILGHRCDNPLCQRVAPEHVVISSPTENRREWVARRTLAGSPLSDPRGSGDRARRLRDLLRRDPALVAEELLRLRLLYGDQPPLR